jgi:heat shock protein HslJ
MRRFVVIAAVLASMLLLAGCGPSNASLTGRMWKLTAVTVTGTGSHLPPGVVPVADQTRYTIEFATDGTFSATADCNQLSGTYTTSGNSITITAGPMTLAACPPDSFGDAYVAALGQASTYAVGSSVLTLTLTGGGSLTYG